MIKTTVNTLLANSLTADYTRTAFNHFESKVVQEERKQSKDEKQDYHSLHLNTQALLFTSFTSIRFKIILTAAIFHNTALTVTGNDSRPCYFV